MFELYKCSINCILEDIRLQMAKSFPSVFQQEIDKVNTTFWSIIFMETTYFSDLWLANSKNLKSIRFYEVYKLFKNLLSLSFFQTIFLNLRLR